VLRIIEGSRAGYSVRLVAGKKFLIGRRVGDLLFEDPWVSSEHCVLDFDSGQWWVEDLGSTNGTRIDGELVTRTVWREGAELKLGRHRMTLHTGLDTPYVRPSKTDQGTGSGCAWLLDEELEGDRGRSGQESGACEMDPMLALPSGMSVVVEVVAGVDAGRVFRLATATAIVGRGEGEIPLEDTEVSRHHAVLECFGRDMIFLRDLQSTNGTFLNGRSIQLARIERGDQIGVGTTLLRLETSDMGPPSTTH
jgi:pSer/pThr/pTyr-binding forkhead associated (FHA) protein